MIVPLSNADDTGIRTSVSADKLSESDTRSSDTPQPPTVNKPPLHCASPTILENRRVSSTSLPHTVLEPSHHKSDTNTIASVPPTKCASSGGTQRSMFSHRTRSDDDCDYTGVVYRTKSSTSMLVPSHTSFPVISTAKSKNSTHRVSSNANDKAALCPPNGAHHDIEQIRSFLESEYVASTDEFWHMQRDSFIHRSYNKKLLARKNAIDEYEQPKRPVTMPLPISAHQPSIMSSMQLANAEERADQLQPVVVKRDSFIRSSFNSFRRSFGIRSSSAKKKSAHIDRHSAKLTRAMTDHESLHQRNGRTINDDHNQEGFTVSDDGLHCVPVEDGMIFLNVPLENVRHLGHSRNSSTSSCTSNRSAINGSTLNFRSAPTSPMGPAQIRSKKPRGVPPSPGPHSADASAKNDSKSIKLIMPSGPNTTSLTGPSTTGRSPSPHPSKAAKQEVTTEKLKKEKNRSETSNSRQKTFHRHFQQVASTEHVVNYFSCALVSDILLQGHLYITNNYFAFYSNVFGFVTKLLIPTGSVVKISKEKTAKIIPNAIGVATAEERHVFASFIRREAAYRLMLSIWLPVVEPTNVAEVAIAKSELREPAGDGDVEASEFSIEDDSSSAISGNESPPVGVQESATSTDASQTVRHRLRVNGIGVDAVDNAVSSSGLVDESSTNSSACLISDFPQSLSGPNSITSRSTSPQPIMVHRLYHFEISDIFVCIGCILSVVLVLISIFLVYRIMHVSSNNSIHDLDLLHAKLNGDVNIDVYAEVVKLQHKMQSKGADEAQIIINLESIARVRKSLETLSKMIHDRNAAVRPLEMGKAASDADVGTSATKTLPLDSSVFDHS